MESNYWNITNISQYYFSNKCSLSELTDLKLLKGSANAFTDLICFAHTDMGRNITVGQRWNINIKMWDRTRNVFPQWPQTTRMPSGWTGRAGWAGCSSGIIITGLRLMIRLLGAQKNNVSFSLSTYCKLIINAIKYISCLITLTLSLNC